MATNSYAKTPSSPWRVSRRSIHEWQQPALDSLFELRDAESGVLRRYATEALRHVVGSLSGATLDGNPVVISVGDPEVADVFPAGTNVVQRNGSADTSNGISIESAEEIQTEEKDDDENDETATISVPGSGHRLSTTSLPRRRFRSTTATSRNFVHSGTRRSLRSSKRVLRPPENNTRW